MAIKSPYVVALAAVLSTDPDLSQFGVRAGVAEMRWFGPFDEWRGIWQYPKCLVA